MTYSDRKKCSKPNNVPYLCTILLEPTSAVQNKVRGGGTKAQSKIRTKRKAEMIDGPQERKLIVSKRKS